MSARNGTALQDGPGVLFAPTSIGAPPRPQVNLLPPEVRSSRALSRIKVRLGVALLALLLVVALAFAWSAFAERAAAQELADKQAESARLVAEQAQYAEVPLVKGQIEATTTARTNVTSTEVLWPDYIAALQSVTPAGVRVSDLTTIMPNPLLPPTSSSSPLDAPSVGSVAFTAQATTLPDIAAWMDALDAIPGFADPTYTTAQLAENNGTVGYTISVIVQVDATAYAERYVPGEDS